MPVEALARRDREHEAVEGPAVLGRNAPALTPNADLQPDRSAAAAAGKKDWALSPTARRSRVVIYDRRPGERN